MLEGFYTAASGILTQERTINVLTNNIANSRTPGFKASRVISTTFEHEFLTRIEGGNSGAIGKGAPIRIVSEVPTRFDPDSLEETGRPYDMAINGDGFFNVLATASQIEAGAADPAADPAAPAVPPAAAQLDEGAQYMTRNGNFDVDADGFLILRGVGQVLGQKGPIQLETAGFTVEPDGTIYDQNGKLVDTLKVTTLAEGAALKSEANGLYTTENIENNPQVGGDVSLVQGWVERPNMDLNREYTLVMEAQRAFQACASALQVIDKVNQKAASTIASL